jgi:hypothetical protein
MKKKKKEKKNTQNKRKTMNENEFFFDFSFFSSLFPFQQAEAKGCCQVAGPGIL